MTKTYYYFGYCSIELNWEDTFKNSSNIIIYKDFVIDSLMNVDLNNYYIITNEKILNINVTYMNEYITLQDIENIIMSNCIIYVKGFLFLRRKKLLINKMVNSNCDNDFNDLSNKLNLDTWKYEFYHKKFLFKKMEKLINKNVLPITYDIKRDHPLIVFFMDFLRSCFKLINKRIFSIIIIGDTKIGKSVCFKECLIDNKYIEYHNSMLEFSKCSDENKKVFRLMDDINWNTVDIMTLKTILNRNVASVDVKYSYGIIYPMINIFLMNKEDYLIFQKKYVDIWSFISNNVAIFPKQNNTEKVIEEINELYDLTKDFENNYLFNEILNIKDYENEFNDDILNGRKPNIYECIKSKLLDNQPYIYDNKQFIDLTSFDISLLPNRQLIENEMLKKIKEVETKEKYEEKVEKKPKKIVEKSNDKIKNKNCLDYYFHRDRKKKKQVNDNYNDKYNDNYDDNYLDNNEMEDYSDDYFDDDDDLVNDNGSTKNIFDNDNDLDNDLDNDMDEFGDGDDLLNDSFNC